MVSGKGRTIAEVQQTMAESIGFNNEIIWDLLSDKQADILRRKIKALAPDPEGEKGRKAMAAMRDNLFNSVWAQRKYTNGQSLTSIFYVLVATGETNIDDALQSKKWSCHPVFRARRCISDSNGKSNDSSDCCMIYIDENSRVYHSWDAYLNNNELPEGVMVAPPHGVYKLNGSRSVNLKMCFTPASSTASQIVGALDVVSAVGGLGAAAVPLVGLAVTVAAPVVLAASTVGLCVAGYTTLRGALKLFDRGYHEQSVSLADDTARGQWVSVAGGAVGLGAAGATKALTTATNAGMEVGAITQFTVNGLNITSIVISGTGTANGILDLILKVDDGDDISPMDVLQLSTSLFLFTHSLYNFRLASQIITETSNNRISNYRDTLSNRQRRTFDKIVKETTRIKGVNQAKIDIIRNVNEMPSRQQFNDLYKIKGSLNDQGIRPSFAANGQGIELNGQVITNTAELRASVQHKVGPDILARVTNPIPETFSGETPSARADAAKAYNSRKFNCSSVTTEPRLDTPEKTSDVMEYMNTTEACVVVIDGIRLVLEFGESFSKHVLSMEDFQNALLSLADNMSVDVIKFVLNLTEMFTNKYREKVIAKIGFFISSESVLYRIGTTILNKYRKSTAEQLQQSETQILEEVESYFMSLNPNSFRTRLTKCNTCKGYYSNRSL